MSLVPDEFDESRVPAFFASALWVPPTVELIKFRNKPYIRWEPLLGESGEEQYLRVNAPPGLLSQFAELKGAKPECILRFVKQYGPLQLCNKHGLPSGHDRYCYSWFREPVESWCALARSADALVQLNSPHIDLTRKERADALNHASWLSQRMGVWPSTLRDIEHPSVKRMRGLIRLCVNDWLACSSMQPQLDEKGRLIMLAETSDGPNLFGVLAVALAYEIAGGSARVPCWRCKKWCELPPNASPHRHHYCEECRARTSPYGYSAPVADAQRALWLRKQEARKLRRTGSSLKAIAAKLHLKPRKDPKSGRIIAGIDRVRRWVEE